MGRLREWDRRGEGKGKGTNELVKERGGKVGEEIEDGEGVRIKKGKRNGKGRDILYRRGER
jgi:hypothetical protein